MEGGVFGPVAPVIGFSTVDEAVELANDNNYGFPILGDVGTAMEIADRIESGKIHINEQTVSDELHDPVRRGQGLRQRQPRRRDGGQPRVLHRTSVAHPAPGDRPVPVLRPDVSGRASLAARPSSRMQGMTQPTRIRGIGDIAGESVTLLGAGRAILLQLAHPAVGHGVARHSVFAEDPMKRLHGTLRYIYSLTSGTPEQAAAVAAHVDAVHARVRGSAAGDGSHAAYDARDPELQLWVAATLHDSAVRVHDAVFPVVPPEVAEEVYRGYAVLGTALQLPEGMWPATRADFAEYSGTRGGRAARGRDHPGGGARAPALAQGLLVPASGHAAGAPDDYRAAAGAVARAVRAALVPAPRAGLPSGAADRRGHLPAAARTIRHAPMRYYLRSG